eukprot:11181371-Lingulodinium_polyedra.AAC.1
MAGWSDLVAGVGDVCFPSAGGSARVARFLATRQLGRGRCGCGWGSTWASPRAPRWKAISAWMPFS